MSRELINRIPRISGCVLLHVDSLPLASTSACFAWLEQRKLGHYSNGGVRIALFTDCAVAVNLIPATPSLGETFPADDQDQKLP